MEQKILLNQSVWVFVLLAETPAARKIHGSRSRYTLCKHNHGSFHEAARKIISGIISKWFIWKQAIHVHPILLCLC